MMFDVLDVEISSMLVVDMNVLRIGLVGHSLRVCVASEMSGCHISIPVPVKVLIPVLSISS